MIYIFLNKKKIKGGVNENIAKRPIGNVYIIRASFGSECLLFFQGRLFI